MRKQQRVVWNKGMFLTPQHFQTQDQFFEDTLQFRFDASHFANWGVTELQIDEESLMNGLFRLQRCRGVLPDGLPFSIPENDEMPPSRALADSFPPTQEALNVYLAIPEWRPRARNIALEGVAEGPATTRYRAETRQIVDDNAGVEDKPVQVARTTFRLILGDEYRDGLTSLRIAQVVRSPAGSYVLHPTFVAPCLDLAHSGYLMMLLRRQIEILAAKSASLAGPRRQRGKSLAEFSASDTANFWLLHTINSSLPELKHVFTVRHGHPEPLFVALLRLAGELSTFSLTGDPSDLPQYDHDNLGLCFSQLDQRITDLMKTVIPSNYISIPLQYTDQFVWQGTVTDDRYFQRSQFYLAVSGRIGVDDLIRKVPELMKVASPEEIRRVVRNALPGVTLRHAPSPPSAIPLKLDNQYFVLNQGGPLWETIVRTRNLCVFAPSEIADPKMEVLVVLEG